MNTPFSFQAGWAMFFIAGVGGGYLGYLRNQEDQKGRFKQNEIYLQQRQEAINRLDERLQREKALRAVVPSKTDTIPVVDVKIDTSSTGTPTP
jgi:hypothetical protein